MEVILVLIFLGSLTSLTFYWPFTARTDLKEVHFFGFSGNGWLWSKLVADSFMTGWAKIVVFNVYKDLSLGLQVKVLNAT